MWKCQVELVRIHSVGKMPWWQAPFLARWDMQSHLDVPRLADLVREVPQRDSH